MKPGALIFFAVFGIFWSSMTLLFDGVIGRGIIGEWRSRTFSETTGHVRKSALTMHGTSRKGAYTADLLYDYQVNGQGFTGTRLRYGAMGSGSRRSAQSVVGMYPADSPIRVHFDPSNPADSVIEAGVTGQSLFIVMFMTPFNVVMLGLWWVVLDIARVFGANRPAGGVRVFQEAMSTHARLPRTPAAAAGLLALIGASIGAIFLVGFSTEMNPSLPAVMWAWSAVLGFSGWVFLRRRRTIQSGAEDLVIDEYARELRLPQTFGRKESVRIPFSAVESVIVEDVARRGRRGGVSHSFAPTLRFRHDGKAERLAEWSSREKAGAFAEWLRGKIGA